MDYLKLYDMERYLFDVVGPAFHKNGSVSAFNFFCIIIWKANRAKSKIAFRLIAQDTQRRKDLSAIVKDITSTIAKANSDKERMRILVEDWRFRLPMASAILTVLYPETFTVYDVRVCDQLGAHHTVQNKSRFDDVWNGYADFLDDVKNRESSVSGLRKKDRILWAKSFEKQLTEDILTLYRKADEK